MVKVKELLKTITDCPDLTTMLENDVVLISHNTEGVETVSVRRVSITKSNLTGKHQLCIQIDNDTKHFDKY